MILIYNCDALYYETAELICDYCNKREQYNGITRDMYSELLTKNKWLTQKYHCDDMPTLKIFCCEECKNKFDKLYNKQNTKDSKTKKKVK